MESLGTSPSEMMEMMEDDEVCGLFFNCCPGNL